MPSLFIYNRLSCRMLLCMLCPFCAVLQLLNHVHHYGWVSLMCYVSCHWIKHYTSVLHWNVRITIGHINIALSSIQPQRLPFRRPFWIISADEGKVQREQVSAGSRQHATPLQGQATPGNGVQSAVRPQQTLSVAASINSVDQSMARFASLKEANVIVYIVRK